MVKGLKPFLKPQFDHTVYIPGAKLQTLFDYVWSRRRLLRKSVVYLAAGPFLLTRKNEDTREIMLKQEVPTNKLEAMIKILRKILIAVIICPLTPIEFTIYNDLTARQQTYKHFYKDWTESMTKAIVQMNRAITGTNSRMGVITPFTHKYVLKKTSGRYKFRWWHLSDGLHFGQDARKAQIRELKRNAELNFNKILQDLRAMRRTFHSKHN